MGQNEIIVKLRNEFKKGIKEESQVVFVMTRMRKILEIRNQKKLFKLINFYSNWTVHTELSGKGTKKLLASLFDSVIDISKNGKEIAKNIKSSHPKFFELNSLKNEILVFLKLYGIDPALFEKNWQQFRKHMLDIIKNCPVKSHKIKELKLVKERKNIWCFRFVLNDSKKIPKIKLKFKN